MTLKPPPSGPQTTQRATAAQRGYGAAWQKARAAYLRRHPVCKMCEQQGHLVPASVVDHINPHKGDRTLFWDSENWQSLCKTCHDSAKQSEDRTGRARVRGCDAAGNPLAGWLACMVALSARLRLSPQSRETLSPATLLRIREEPKRSNGAPSCAPPTHIISTNDPLNPEGARMADSTRPLFVRAAIDPVSQAAGTATSPWVNAMDFLNCMALVDVGVFGASATVDAKLQQATDAVGPGAADVPAKAITQLVAGGGNNRQAVIRLTPAVELGAKPFIRLSITVGTAASQIAGFIFGVGGRYGNVMPSDAATVAQVV